MAMVKLDKNEEEIVTLYESAKDFYQEEVMVAKYFLKVMTTDEASFRVLRMLIKSVYRARQCNRMLNRLVQTEEIAAQYDRHLKEMMHA